MKVITYKPNKITDAETGEPYDSPFEGSIKIEMPSYEERIKMARAMKVDKENPLDMGEEFIKLINKRVMDVSLSVKGSEDNIDCLEDLGYFKEGTDLINEVGRTIMRGVQLGNR